MTPLPPFSVAYRPLTPHDQSVVWDMLYHAIYIPSGGTYPARSILEDPEIAHYAADFGRPGDLGFLASSGELPVGAAWLRLFPPDDPGYGFVAPDMPEISLAVVPGWRGQGIGTRLLGLLLTAAELSHPAVSLSVVAANPAVRLYRRTGFVTLRHDGDSLAMIRKFAHDENG